jgi:hypothetical protein
MAEDTLSARITNSFDRMEVAGAFGDLGTLVPFIVAYISVLKMEPLRRAPLNLNNRTRICQLALRYQISAVSESSNWARAGLLLAYGQDAFGTVTRAMDYVDEMPPWRQAERPSRRAGN